MYTKPFTLQTKPLQFSLCFHFCSNLSKVIGEKEKELLAHVKENCSKENTCAVLQCCLNNVERRNFFKRASSAGVFMWILQNSYEYVFLRTLLSNCFDTRKTELGLFSSKLHKSVVERVIKSFWRLQFLRKKGTSASLNISANYVQRKLLNCNGQSCPA